MKFKSGNLYKTIQELEFLVCVGDGYNAKTITKKQGDVVMFIKEKVSKGNLIKGEHFEKVFLVNTQLMTPSLIDADDNPEKYFEKMETK